MNLKSSMNSKKTEEREEMKKAESKKEKTKQDEFSEMPTPKWRLSQEFVLRIISQTMSGEK